MPSFLKLTFLIFCFSFYQINCSEQDSRFGTSQFALYLNAASEMSLKDFIRWQDKKEEEHAIKIQIKLKLEKQEAINLAKDKATKDRASSDLRSVIVDIALSTAIPSDFFQKHTLTNFNVSELRHLKKFSEEKFEQIRKEMDRVASNKRKRGLE